MNEIKKIAVEIQDLNTRELLGDAIIKMSKNNKNEVIAIKEKITYYLKGIDILKTKTYKKLAEVQRAKELIDHLDITAALIDSYLKVQPEGDEGEKKYNEEHLN